MAPPPAKARGSGAGASGTNAAASGVPAPPSPAAGREVTPTPSAIAARATLLAEQSCKKKKDHATTSNTDEKFFTNITSKDQFTDEVNKAGNKLVIVSFHAQWCGACKMAAMTLRELAKTHVDKLLVLRVDVEEMEEMALENDILSIPAFVFMHEKRKLGMEMGSNAEKLHSAFEKYVNMRS